jgi:hypothetical protein
LNQCNKKIQSKEGFYFIIKMKFLKAFETFECNYEWCQQRVIGKNSFISNSRIHFGGKLFVYSYNDSKF